MDWIRENKIPAAILGVSAAGAIALGVVLFTAYSNYSTSLDSFEAVKGSLARLKGAPLSPTPENLAAKKALVDEYSASVGKLSLVLHKLQKPEVPITNNDFQAKLKARIAATRKLAADHRVQLPAEFSLAFGKYTSELPKSDEVAMQLSSYLDAVDGLVHLLIDSGIFRMDLLERTDLPAEGASSASAPPKPAPRSAPNKKGAAAAKPEAPAAAKVTEKSTVRTMVVVDQAALQIIMSKLASPSETADLPYFPIVRLLRVENEQQVGPMSNVANAAVPGPQPGAQPPATGGVDSVKPANPDSLVILGKENLRVFLEIDLVKFL